MKYFLGIVVLFCFFFKAVVSDDDPDPLGTIKIINFDAKYDVDQAKIILRLERGPGRLKSIILEMEDPTNKKPYDQRKDSCLLFNDPDLGQHSNGWDKNLIKTGGNYIYEKKLTVEQFQTCLGVTTFPMNGQRIIAGVFHGILTAEKTPTAELAINPIPHSVLYSQEFRTAIFLKFTTSVNTDLPCLHVSRSSQYHFMALEHSESHVINGKSYQDAYVAVYYPNIDGKNDIFDHITLKAGPIVGPKIEFPLASANFEKLNPNDPVLAALGIQTPPTGFKKEFFRLRVRASSCGGFPTKKFQTSIEFENAAEHTNGEFERLDIDIDINMPDICANAYDFYLYADMCISTGCNSQIILTKPVDILATIESEHLEMDAVYFIEAQIVVGGTIFELAKGCSNKAGMGSTAGCLTALGDDLNFKYRDITFTPSKVAASATNTLTKNKVYKAFINFQMTFGLNIDEPGAAELYKKLEDNFSSKTQATLLARFGVGFKDIDEGRRSSSPPKVLAVQQPFSILKTEESSSTPFFVFSIILAATLIFAFL